MEALARERALGPDGGSRADVDAAATAFAAAGAAIPQGQQADLERHTQVLTALLAGAPAAAQAGT